MNRLVVCAAALVAFGFGVAFAEDASESKNAPAKTEVSSVKLGKELFHRDWLPNDPRSHGGDGLGPVFNETSCVACHNQGGIGGGGAAANNISILSLTSIFPANKLSDQQRKQLHEQVAALRKELGVKDEKSSTVTSFVVHRFGLSDDHSTWKTSLFTNLHNFAQQQNNGLQPVQAQPVVQAGVIHSVGTVGTAPPNLMTRVSQRINQLQASSRIVSTSMNIGLLTMSTTQRNTTALFGVGLIDSITDEQIEAAAVRKFDDFPRVTGRVARTSDGKIAKFGWKGNVATLRDFTMAACAVELGLQVPGQAQSPVLYKKDYKPEGLDINDEELDALVDYLTGLPRPIERGTHDKAADAILAEGKELFTSIGCATCHTPKLGDVEGIYSDLLLHDLGPQLGDIAAGTYGQSSSSSPLPLANADKKDKPKHKPATAVEWRTPPLWGCRDSAPYLHDGRAESLEQAIALHDGEAQDSTLQFMLLPPHKRQILGAFLKTLQAPEK